jgi:hypothetical protein
MKNFEDWQKDQKHLKKVSYGIALFCLFMGIVYEFKNGSIWWVIVSVLFGYVAWNTKTTIEGYEKDVAEQKKKIAAEKRLKAQENKRIEKEKLAKEQKDKPRKDKYEKRLSSLDNLDKQLKILQKIECWDPKECKSILINHENEISQKLGDTDLHKILKIVNFVHDFSKEVDNLRYAIIDEIDINDIKYKLKNDFERDHGSMEVILEKAQFQTERLDGINTNLYSHVSGGVYGCTRIEALTESIIALGDKFVPQFDREVKKVQYLESLCISMIVFGIEGKKLRYFEILESFEKLGALDSTWQKNVQNNLNSIENKLDIIMNGIISFNGKMDDLINSGDQVVKELESINSSIATGNVIQALNLYQNYKINKNTKSLRQ